MTFAKGQSVAAKVDYNNQACWVIAKVLDYNKQNKTYLIEDLIPEDKAKQWTVSRYQLVQFPQNLKKIQKGQRLLALWYEEEINHWTTIFYPCQAIEVYQENKHGNSQNTVLKVKFDGDPKYTFVNSQWTICPEQQQE
ncbi:SGF29_tudor-like domain-containing protein [Hexamita inflata]|uniref:SGF29_tudor-like domain-containing protein n=1 Tax=Hexamita inflata TaxID=28002 RepID=A0ABP1HGS3_9EUKA